jgi:hypothetical protein
MPIRGDPGSDPVFLLSCESGSGFADALSDQRMPE